MTAAATAFGSLWINGAAVFIDFAETANRDQGAAVRELMRQYWRMRGHDVAGVADRRRLLAF